MDYLYSSMELKKSTEQVLPRREGGERERVGAGSRGKEMIQTIYAHVNK
jgi:hypothetical protein